MVRVVGVRFKPIGKIYYFDPGDHPVAVGQNVVVETARGLEYGEVSVGPRLVRDDEVVQPLKRVVRIGTEADRARVAENKKKEKEAWAVAIDRIVARELDMNLVDVEYAFDGSRITFYFTAEGRIDFRELVKDLAAVFRTRIEMRQIGVRDEAKLLGGIGPCGRILCCSSWLAEFAPVSIRMAKDQNLSLSPTKISGLCGRLMCCLRYEQETYEAAKKDPTLRPGYVPPVDLGTEDDMQSLEDEPLTVRPTPPKVDRFAGQVARALATESVRAMYDEPATTVTLPATAGGQPPPAGGEAAEKKRKRRRRSKAGAQGGQAPAQSQEAQPVPANQPPGPKPHTQQQGGGTRAAGAQAPRPDSKPGEPHGKPGSAPPAQPAAEAGAARRRHRHRKRRGHRPQGQPPAGNQPN